MSSLKDQLKSDLTNAMKSRNEVETSTLRMTLAAIMNAEVAGDQAVELTNDQVLAVVSSEAKKRAESADIYKEAGRQDAEASERAELAILERYLPAQMSDSDLEKIIDLAIAEVAGQGLTGPKAMGAVVKAVRGQAGAGADGAVARAGSAAGWEYAVGSGGPAFAIGLGLALLLDRDFPGRNALRSLMLLPWAVP
ncbi:MAG: GatB/YqeY domain-containing protein, partial [Ilumatobacteraceae bacterium]